MYWVHFGVQYVRFGPKYHVGAPRPPIALLHARRRPNLRAKEQAPLQFPAAQELQGRSAVRTRLELATSAVTGRHSNQLNYRSKPKNAPKNGEQIY